LLNWVKARSASAKATDPTMLYRTETTSATTRKSSLGRGSKTPTLPDEVFLVKIPADQLPSLVVYLDAPPNQTAAVDRSAQGGAAGAVPTLLANQGAKVERGKDPHRIGGAVRPEAKDRRTAKPSVPSVAGSRLRPVAIFTTPLPEEDGQRTLQLDSNASTDAEPLMSVAVVIRSQRRIEEAQDVLRDSQRRTD
jgi:hypothetical protein